MRKIVLLLVPAVLILFVPASHAADLRDDMEGKTQQKTAQSIEDIDKTFQQMGPMMSSMMEAVWDGMFRFMAKKETAKNMALFAKNYYDALIALGFTEAQALEIVKSGSSFPALMSK